MRLARSLLALVNGSEKWPFDKGAEMTQRTDVYTTIGHGCGCCGHRQQSVREAGRCLAKYRAEEISDRRVVAVAADAPWPPTEGCDLNAAELDALYAEAGLPAAADEHERLARFTAGIAADVAAVRRVADALHNAWAEGGPGRDTKENAEIADCRLPRHGAGARDGRAGCGFALHRASTVLLTRRASMSEATAVQFRWDEPGLANPVELRRRASRARHRPRPARAPEPPGPGRDDGSHRRTDPEVGTAVA